MATAVQSTGAEPRVAWPTVEGMEEQLRTVRRTATAVRHASEDAAAEAVLHIRRHPAAAVGGAAFAGAIAGALFGFAAGWWVQHRQTS